MTTDTQRLDFVEQYLLRPAHLQTGDGHYTEVRTWSVVTAAPGDLRETIDSMMAQRQKLQHG